MSKAEELQNARDRYAALGARNTYGLTPDERIELDKEYLEAQNLLFKLLEEGYK